MALPRKLIYPAVFSYDDGICVYFPDVDGCYSQADSTEEAFYMAKDALELVLEDYIFNMFEDAPKPSQIKDIKVESNQCVALIEVDVDKLIKRNSSKTINKTLTLPSWLNELGIKNKLNFSKILQDGIKKEFTYRRYYVCTFCLFLIKSLLKKVQKKRSTTISRPVD